ncbi:hypothetical protein ACSNOI_27480 [Actinomadura kijaniata]|uniref:hypothetical protein n=1 Tax=Actinomadura kijaniata TaxID=46161 RepID=UPI003F1E259A
MRTNLTTRAGLVGVAAATALTLAPAANAAPAAPTRPAAPRATAPTTAPFGEAAAQRARWWTIKYDIHRRPTKTWSPQWNRPSGVRVMQIVARCWGGDHMNVRLAYKRSTKTWRVIKTGKWDCTGGAGYLRIHNAGHKTYRVFFKLKRKGKIDYWAQAYS